MISHRDIFNLALAMIRNSYRPYNNDNGHVIVDYTTQSAFVLSSI